jgi:hypothetical protein
LTEDAFALAVALGDKLGGEIADEAGDAIVMDV